MRHLKSILHSPQKNPNILETANQDWAVHTKTVKMHSLERIETHAWKHLSSIWKQISVFHQMKSLALTLPGQLHQHVTCQPTSTQFILFPTD